MCPERRRPVGVVTGASSGIGRWIALGLARAGYHVVLICRDSERGSAVARWIASDVPDSSTELLLADLSSLHETQRLGLEIASAHPRIGVLVNNAGMFTAKRQITAEGIDAVLAVNHLAPLVLADVLEGALLAGAPSRIVNVGSSTSDHAAIDPDDLECRRRWSMTRAYASSKLAMMMATFARAERLRGSGVVANVVHPGLVATSLIRERGPIGLAWRLMSPFARTEEQGAATPLHVALSPDWATITGAYAKDRAVARPNRRALDPALVARVELATRALTARTLGAKAI
ncbi:MAG: SDR family NAD(P)-dependent oxidoreductase [Pseudomonadota bacterium]